MPRRNARLQTRFLPEKTRQVFKRLRDDTLLKGMTLVGGSAIALQIGHRISEDLDFAVLAGRLPGARMDALTAQLEAEGHEVSLLTPHSQISAFRINTGKKLLDYARDYVIGGAKVTFFARGHNAPASQIEFLKQQPPAHDFAGFNVMNLAGLFAMKALVLGDRARSRDLFDLMTLIKTHGFTLDEALSIAATYAPIHLRDVERYKSVMLGIIPLDPDDEGFEGLGVSCTLGTIYKFFEQQIAAYERRIAKKILEN